MSVYPPPQVPTTRTSTTAIISLVAGICGWSILPFLGSLVAIITGHIAMGEIKKGGGMITGKGMATAGLIMGYLSIALGLCVLCLAIILPLFGLSLLDWSSLSSYSY